MLRVLPGNLMSGRRSRQPITTGMRETGEELPGEVAAEAAGKGGGGNFRGQLRVELPSLLLPVLAGSLGPGRRPLQVGRLRARRTALCWCFFGSRTGERGTGGQERGARAEVCPPAGVSASSHSRLSRPPVRCCLAESSTHPLPRV